MAEGFALSYDVVGSIALAVNESAAAARDSRSFGVEGTCDQSVDTERAVTRIAIGAATDTWANDADGLANGIRDAVAVIRQADNQVTVLVKGATA